MTRPPGPKATFALRFRQAVAGLGVLACLVALLFALLRWRANTPELHLNFDGVDHQPAVEQTDE
jgi:hypothetical protein